MARTWVALVGLAVLTGPAHAQTWTGPHGPNSVVRGLALDPGGDRAFAATDGSGVYRSLDGGATWSRVLSGSSSTRRARAVVIDPLSPTTIYAATDNGVHRSTNGGSSWAQVDDGLNGNADDVRALAIDPGDPDVVYAGTRVGVYRSEDGGDDWSPATSGMGTNRVVQALAVHPATPQVLYAGTSSGLFRSINGGGSWSLVTGGISSSANVQALLIDPLSPATLYVGATSGLLRSTNGGASFASFNGAGGGALPSTNVQALAIDGATLFAGTPAGLATSQTTAASWTETLSQNTRAVAVDAFVALAGASGVFRQQRLTAKTIASGDWSDAGRWSPPGVPGAGDVCVVQGPVTIAASSPTAARVIVRGGGALTVGANRTLTVGGRVDVEAGVLSLSAAGGAVAAGDDVTIGPGARLELASTGQLRLAGGASLAVSGTLRGRSAAASIGRASGTTGVDVRVLAGGTLDVDGLTLRDGDLEGLHVAAGATIARLRGARFEALATTDPAARFLTLEASSLLLSAPGCSFGALAAGQRNVLLVDADGGADDAVLVLEDRGPAVSGAGAGEARDAEQGGAAVTWVWACPDTTRGAAVGFPQVAWDLLSGASYATYVAFTDVDASGVDRIWVFDPDGQGVERPYWFEVPDGRGDLVGLPWWDTSPTGQHLLWATTTTGYVYLWTDPGAGAGAVAPAAGWPKQLVTSFSTAPVADRTNVYAAGRFLFFPFIGGVDRATLSLTWAAFTSHEVRSGLATEVNEGVNYVFGGSQRGGDGRARIFRVNTQTQVVDRTNTDATADIVASPFVFFGKGLFVGDRAGRVHGLDQLSFARRPGFPVAASPSPIEAGVFLDFVTDDRVYAGDTAGRLVAIEPTGAIAPGWPIQPLGPAAIGGMPIVDLGVLWAGNAGGRFAAVEVASRATLAEWRFGAGARLSDVGQEFTTGRTMVSTSRGGFYVVAVLP